MGTGRSLDVPEGDPVVVAFVALLLSAVCAGGATVLQARAARRMPTADHLDAGLLLGLLRRTGYLVALALLVVGMLLAIYALRSLPLYLVQAVRSSSLGVTALLSVLVLKQRLLWSELAAVAAVGAGIVVLALTSAEQSSGEVGTGARFAVLGTVVVLALAAVPLGRRPAGTGSTVSAVSLAVLAGLSFAVLALGARTLRGFAPLTLVTDPAAWAMGLAGVLGLLLSATALQRASVVTVTAATVATEAVAAAVLGLVVCGDRPVAGDEPAAIVGFLLAVGGALGLARFGAPAEEEVTRPTPV